jgi:hypothetical protein
MDGGTAEGLAQGGRSLAAAMMAGAAPDGYADRRRHVREKVLKAAKIIFGGGDSIFNCLVLDESPDGVFVDLGGAYTLPAEVTIQFSSGAAFRAVRRWSTGTRVGFEFVGKQIVDHETANRMQAVAEILRNHGIAAAMQTLRVAQYFDNLELRRVAETAEIEYRRLEAALGGERRIL